MSSFCEQNEIVHEFTTTYTSESNGVAEKKNRTFIETVNAMLLSSSVCKNFWGEALLLTCFILNSILFKDCSTQHPMNFGKEIDPQLNNFKVSGCLAKV